VTPPRWLADEMVGRLARYLRFVGCDTLYARGWTDAEIESRARSEGRVVVTRDRALTARAAAALLLTSPNLADQWRSVRKAYPEVPNEPRFERCSECNGALAPFVPSAGAPRAPGIPWDRVERGLPLYRCADCGHCYWEGSHVASVRVRLASWAGEGPG
jgi:uncharacterized protein